MLKRIEYSNGYIEFYPSHWYGYNFKTAKGKVFIGYTISEIKRKLGLKN